jgi:two-component system OmpR family response regulator
MINVAMVEDDIDLATMLTEYLENFNIKVTNYDDPFFGLSAIRSGHFDLVILDLTLPGLDGLEVCKEIVANKRIPIIISSARSDIADKVTALELGADDYLPKPYDPRELEVRIKTILRRYHNEEKEEEKKEIFNLDLDKQEITKNGKFIKLTAAEFEILALLIQRKGFVVSREYILDNSEVMNNDYEQSGSLAVIINRIRHKIEDDPKKPHYLQTIRGIGYKLVEY